MKRYACSPRSLMFAAFALACGRDEPTSPSVDSGDPATALYSISVSPRVAIVAVGATQQLSVSGVSLTGAPIASLDTVKLVLANASDTARIRLSSDGLVTALAPSSAPILINVFGIKDQAARGDQAVLQVTATVVSGVTLSIQPTAPDSAKLARGSIKTIVPVVRNSATGQSVSNPVMRYFVKGSDVARVGVYAPTLTLPVVGLPVEAGPNINAPGVNQIRALAGEGTAWIRAAMTAYGTPLQDSVLYTFSYPYSANIVTFASGLLLKSDWAVATVYFAAGATLGFFNNIAATDGTTLTYTFDNPSAVTAAVPPSTVGGSSGNVVALPPGGQSSLRRFLTAGTYKWTVTATSAIAAVNGQTLSGTIVIK